jgi:hypothetical protein
VAIRELSPKQRAVNEDLLGRGGERSEPDPGLAERIHERTVEVLATAAAAVPPDNELAVKKHDLSWAHTCAGYLKARKAEPFQWTVANVRGRVTHRSLESVILAREPMAPLDAADAAIDYLIDTSTEATDAGAFLRELSPSQRQDLLRDANDYVLKFLADWPPIDRRWLPRVESPVRVPVGQVVLRATVDLALGPPERTFVVDFKTGREHDDDRNEARYYALVQTLRFGAAPYRVATYYLDSGNYTCDDVDEQLLEDTLAWVAEGVRRIAALQWNDEVEYEPGGACRWCPASGDCAEGQAWLQAFTPRK